MSCRPEDLPDYLQNYRFTWKELRIEFSFLKMLLESFHLPTEEQLAEHRKKKMVTDWGPLDQRLDWGAAAYPGDREYREAVEAFNKDLQYSESDWEEVETALRERRLSIAFLRAWGNLQHLAGRLAVLRSKQPAAEAYFQKGIAAGAATSTHLQSVWYARWLAEHCRPWSQTLRETVETALAELCREIVQSERQPPAGFQWNWFEKMIAPEKQEFSSSNPMRGQDGDGVSKRRKKLRRVSRKPNGVPVYLRSSFTRLGREKVRAVAKSEDVASEQLPPLRLEKFPPKTATL